jgi:hypothetical protein
LLHQLMTCWAVGVHHPCTIKGLKSAFSARTVKTNALVSASCHRPRFERVSYEMRRSRVRICLGQAEKPLAGG